MVRPNPPDRRQVQGLIVLLAVVFAAMWLNTRRPATADRSRPQPASRVPVALPVIRCAICGKPINGAVMVRTYEDGATDRIHPTCYTKATSDPPVKVGK
jgi:hypothetical protein